MTNHRDLTARVVTLARRTREALRAKVAAARRALRVHRPRAGGPRVIRSRIGAAGRSEGEAGIDRDADPVAWAIARLDRGVGRRRRDLDGAERELIDRIEARRAELEADDTEVEQRLFGAGSPDTQRSAEAMATGWTATRRISDLCRQAVSKPTKAAGLFTVTRALRPSVVIELGSSVGISSAYLAAALAIEDHGRLVTLEGSPALGELTAQGLDRLGFADRAEVVTGRFLDTLPGVLDEVGAVDLAYVDGHHDRDATCDYVERLAAVAAPGAVLVLDDIRWSDGMTEAWERVSAHPQVAHALDAGRIGYLVLTGAAQAEI